MWLHREVETLADIPRYWSQRTPDATALIDARGKVTFAELDAFSDRVARAILACDLPRPSNIGFLGKNSARYFELLFGTLKAGYAIAPLNWRLAASELAAIIDDAQCPIVFVDREWAPLLRGVAGLSPHRFRTIEFDSRSGAGSELEPWVAAADQSLDLPRVNMLDTALLIYTSGTTGRPKGVELSHRGFDGMRVCEHLSGAYEWRSGDVMLTAMPVFHLVGSGLSIQALYNGAAVSLVPMLDPAELIRIITRDKPSICALVPTAIQMLIDHPDAATADFSSLRVMMYAGSPISSTLLRQALKTLPCGFMQFYGASESSGPMTLLQPHEHDSETRLRSCGRPLPLIEFRIVDADGVDVADGEVGEFWVRGPAIFRRYWNQPEATAAVLKDGWYRTGDAGYRDAEGFLYIVDRVKDMIVTGGENVYSAEVEQALAQHPAIQSCAVVGLPDAKWGEKVTAVVVLRPGIVASLDGITLHCRGLIAGYKVPKSILFVESLPVTTSGKIMKRMVREQLLRS